MKWEREALRRIPELLEELLRTPVTVEAEGSDRGVDLALRIGDQRVRVEVRGSDEFPALTSAHGQLSKLHVDPYTLSVIAVPYMGRSARRWAAEHGVSWIDLSGNADIRVRDLIVVVTGKPNRYTAPGRSSNPFTPSYSRVSRALLVQPDRWWKQIDIAREVDLPPGTVSKAVKRLDARDLLERNEKQELRPRQPALLLESWAQQYRFDEHDIRKYHLVARSGVEGLQTLLEALPKSEHLSLWAATGLSAAWLESGSVDFRLNTFYVDQHPPDPERFRLRPVHSGENVWLVVPRDSGVFYGIAQDEKRRVHPVQLHLDLLGHPERAPEAAKEVRDSLAMRWTR
jgi:hypothetical protein